VKDEDDDDDPTVITITKECQPKGGVLSYLVRAESSRWWK
jgi:hypothetical protein